MSKLIREVLIPISGIGIGLNEALVRSGDPRIYILVLAAAMMGLSAFVKPEDIATVLGHMRKGGNGNGHKPAEPTPDDKARPALAIAVARIATTALAWRLA